MQLPGSSATSRARPWLRRGWRALAVTVGCAGGSLLLVNLWMHVRTSAFRYRAADAVPGQQVVVVLGASVYRDGRPSEMLRDRLDTALDLYRAGKVRKILLTGDHGRRAAYDEVNVMRRHVLARGAAPADVFTDHYGFTTYDSIVRAKRIFGVESAIIVTQGFHLPRAVYIARALGLRAVGLAADRRAYRSVTYQHLREAFARGKAWGEVLVGAAPRSLGPPTPITGDGRATWDRDRPGRRR
ncbi:MAG TPA: ElyC/SanA/YdcF family protein [Polyangia bacterium]